MKTKLLFLAITTTLIFSCTKTEPVKPPPPPVAPITTSYTGDKMIGSFKCVLKGYLDMTCSASSYTCRMGHRAFADTFMCNISKSTNWPNSLVADSIWGSSVGLTLMSNTTFKCDYFIYDIHKCAVPLASTYSYGKLSNDTITIINNGTGGDSFYTISNNFVCTMVKQ